MENSGTKKIRPECRDCRFFSGKTPEDASCRAGNIPTYYRKKKTCPDKKFKKKKAVAYTDGSYNDVTKRYGTGVCLYIDGKKYSYTDSGEDIHSGRQVQGEIVGAITACEKAIEFGCTEIEIRYDYNGVEAWPMGFWQAKKDYTIQYAADMKEIMKKIKVSFKHVKAHKGESGNEHADTLAKKACGMIVEDTKKHADFTPEIPDDVNPECREAITKFYQKKKHTFRDFLDLKTYGADPYSKKNFEELKEYAKKNSVMNIRERIGENASGKDYCSCIRWIMRGLSADDAVKKIQTDIEIRENLERKKQERDED